ncbi:MAG: AAA family ATPase [Thiomonas arsenitoxydans]|uniref:AAA family ATPase n=1 Tax=Thiomonas arsenitoxydans (strain DSM 22701 / CIP 110005 / 3As) TaxID=426114 RepID=A0A8I1ST13_THIA3|nr:AAA family ATPase [Thiomonas arsenitoxydans]
MTAKFDSLTVCGFRSCGADPQTLKCGAALTIVGGTNSQGKTSLAEAFEFLLTGRIVRRELTASAQDEFADALRNAHLDAGKPVYVEADVIDTAGTAHKLRRELGWAPARSFLASSTKAPRR